MLRMESARSPWRTLRPLILAGAAATAWLALSAPAASADSPSDSGSLLGGISSAVTSVTGTPSSVTGTAAGPVNDTLASVAHAVRSDAVPATAVAAVLPAAVLPAQPVAADPAGLLHPVTGAVTGTVDYVIEAVPAVNQIVPSGTVGTVTAPVFAAADSVVAEATQAALPAASDALPVLEPVLAPVDDLISGTDTLPLQGSEAVATEARAVTDSSAFDGGFGTERRQASVALLGAVPGSSGLSLTPKSALSLPVANLGPAHSSSVPAGTNESPGNGDGASGSFPRHR